MEVGSVAIKPSGSFGLPVLKSKVEENTQGEQNTNETAPNKIIPLHQNIQKGEGDTNQKEELKKQTENINRFLNTNLEFEVHEETNRYYVRVVEAGTDKVVREIPPKEFLDMIGRMMNYIGMMVDKRV